MVRSMTHMTANSDCLVIRADADPQTGTGHAMRCLALAQAWQDQGGTSLFVMTADAPAFATQLASFGISVSHLTTTAGTREDASLTLDQARRVRGTWIVVDGYHFDAEYQRTLKCAGRRLLFLDDYGHADHYWADLILNQNIYASERLYSSREPYTRLLLGTRYALLRREFRYRHACSRETPPVAHRVLVTLGGGDDRRVTFRVLHALESVAARELDVVVAVGAQYPYYTDLEQSASNVAFTCDVRRDVQNMAELMAWADVAVSAGGTSCLELAFIGVPHAVIVLADNQEAVAAGVERQESGINLGWYHEVTDEKLERSLATLIRDAGQRQAMSSRGLQLVDGHGVTRVIESLMEGAA